MLLLGMQAAADADEINSQEKLFGMASTKYGQVSRMAAKLEPYCSLWTLAARFYDKYAGWMSGPFSKLKPEEVETEVSDAYRKIYKLGKVSLLSPTVVVVIAGKGGNGTAAAVNLAYIGNLTLSQILRIAVRLILSEQGYFASTQC